jgi:translation initiation factor 6 (eIF-6)
MAKRLNQADILKELRSLSEPTTTTPTTSSIKATEGFHPDNYAITDFAGNLIWGGMETFIVPTLIDIVSQTKEGGINVWGMQTENLAEEFGSQEWKDESWAGRAGYLVGTTLGVFTGFGAAGKIAGLVGKPLLRTAAKGLVKWQGSKLKKQAIEEVTELLGKSTLKQISKREIDDVVGFGHKIITKASDTAIKAVKNEAGPGGVWGNARHWWGRSGKINTIMMNPASHEAIGVATTKAITEKLIKITGRADLPKDLVKNIVTTISKYGPKNIDKELALQYAHTALGKAFKGEAIGQYLVAAVHEGLTLAAFDVLTGEAGDLFANYNNMDEKRWERKSISDRAMHGMTMGGLFAAVRGLPGGKDVAFGKSGMVADLKSIGLAAKVRFRNLNKLSWDKKLAATRTMFYALRDDAGKIFKTSITQEMLDEGKKTKQLVQGVDEILKIVKNDISGSFVKRMIGEIAKDGKDSFFRATVGSLLMNWAGYLQRYDDGEIGTEDYPWSQASVDHFVGMLYMKRRRVGFKTGVDEPAYRRQINFFDEKGLKTGESGETLKLLNAMKEMGASGKYLEALAQLNPSLSEVIKDSVIRQSLEMDEGLVHINDVFDQNKTTLQSNAKRLERNIEIVDSGGIQDLYMPWASKIAEKVRALKAEGKHDEASVLDSKLMIAQEIESILNPVIRKRNTVLSLMNESEAVNFLESITSKEVGGKTLRVNNVATIVKKTLRNGSIRVAEQLKDQHMRYIQDSMKALGLNVEIGADGKLALPRNYEEVISEISGVDGDFYLEREVLTGAINKGMNSGLIKVAESKGGYEGHTITADHASNFKKAYDIHTESMHAYALGEKGASNARWREESYTGVKPGEYLDSNILNSASIWNGIQTNFDHKRHSRAFELFAGEGESQDIDTIKGKLRNFMGGAVEIEVEADGKSTLSPEGAIFAKSISDIVSGFNTFKATKGKVKVSVPKIESLREEFNREFGDLLENTARVSELKNSMNVEFIDRLTSDTNISVPIKRALSNIMDGNSKIGTKLKDRIIIIKAERLRELLSDGSLDGSDVKTISQVIDQYENLFQKPIIKALRGGGRIEFAGDRIGINSDRFSLNEVKQEIIEITNMLDANIAENFNAVVGDISQGKLGLDNARTSLDIYQDITKGELSAADSKLRESFNSLFDDYSTFVNRFKYYQETNDAAGLRILAGQHEKIAEVRNEIRENLSIKSSASIEKIREKINDIMSKVKEDYSKHIFLGSEDELNSFIEDISNQTAFSMDRTARPHANTVSISDAKYKSRWGLNDAFVSILKGQSLELIKDSMPDAFKGLTNEALGKLKKAVGNIKVNDMLDQLVQSESGKVEGFTLESFMNSVVSPMMESQRVLIESNPATGDYKLFVRDTFALLSRGLNSKKIPTMEFRDGTFHIKESSISRWDKSINSMITDFGLENEPHAISLLSGTGVVDGKARSFFTLEMINDIITKSGQGIDVELTTHKLLSPTEQSLMDKYKALILSDQSTRSVFSHVQLDEKTGIMVHSSAFDKIIGAWERSSNEPGSLRADLTAVISASMPAKDGSGARTINKAEAIDMVNDYLNGLKSTHENSEVNHVQELVLLTRVLRSGAHKTRELIMDRGAGDTPATLKLLKYLKLDAPRTGMPLSDKLYDFTQAFFDAQKDNLPEVSSKALGIALQHRKDRPTQRILDIYDESGNGEIFFDSHTRAKALYREMLLAERDGYRNNDGSVNESRINEAADQMTEKLESVKASVTNGAKFISLKEMISTLVGQGASEDMFITNKAGNIIGFNNAVKPIAFQTKINSQTGEVSVYIAKTAYTYNPVFDKVMERLGVDAISFESSSKLNQNKTGFGEEYKRPSWDVSENMVDLAKNNANEAWDHSLIEHITKLSDADIKSIPIVELDRNNIFIKSTASEHNATVTTGMYNWLSDGAVNSISTQMGTQGNVSTMNSHINNLKNNPLYSIKLADHLRNIGAQDGNSMTELIGLDWAVTSGGIPLFSNMLAQLDKIVVSEYLGNRNFTTAQTGFGRYPVMVPGSDLSIPQIERASKLRFGGSGMNFQAGTTSIDGQLGGGDNGHHMIFRVGKALSDKTNLKRGIELLVLTNGTIKGINDPRMYKETGMPLQGNIDKAKKIILEDFRTIQKNLSKRNIGSFNDAIIELAFGESIPALNTPGAMRLIMNNRLAGASSPKGSNDVLLTKRGSLEFLKGVKGEDFTREREYDHTLLGENGNHYQGVYFSEVNVRTPMAGVNDRVITKIEKIMGETKGPVSEMNFMDVLEPQDADFDLDKSANFTNLSSRAMEDIYDLQGFESPASESFAEEMLKEFVFSSDGIKDYAAALAVIERKRAPLIRNMNTMSLLYQMTGKSSKGKYWPREARDMDIQMEMSAEKGGRSAEVGVGYNTTNLMSFKSGNDLYNIRLAAGSDLISTTQYMKRMIKSTIDIYKTQQNLNGIDLEGLVWFGSNDGNVLPILQLLRKDKVVGWSSDQAARDARMHITNNIIKPLNSLFNLANRTETLSDGSSIPMTRHDLVKAYNKIKYKIKNSGGRWDFEKKEWVENAYAGLSENILNWIGNKVYSGTEYGESNHPLIQGLKSMEAAEKSLIGYNSTPASSGVLAYVYDKATKSGDGYAYTQAINEIKSSENLHMTVSRIKYDLEKVGDRMVEFENFKKKETSQYKKLEALQARLNKLYIEASNYFHTKMLYDQEKPTSQDIVRFAGTRTAYNGPVHVIKFDKTTKKPSNTIKYKEGKKYEVKEGDIVIENPTEYVAMNSGEQKIFRGQSRAFAGRLKSLSAQEAQYIYGRYINFIQASKDTRKKFTTSSEFQSKDSKASMYEAMTYDVLNEVTGLLKNRGSDSALQFLRYMLAPNVEKNTWGIWSINNTDMIKSVAFKKNGNEITAIGFLDKARNGTFPEISRALGEEWSKHVLTESKKGWAIEFNERARKEFKAGNFVNFESFEEARSPILGKNRIAPGRNKPEFLTADGLNEHAREIMTGYLTGENILNPIEVYRLTTVMNNKPLSESNQAHIIHNRLWRGSEKKSVGVNGIFESTGVTFSEAGRLGSENLKNKTAAESIKEQLFNCHY